MQTIMLADACHGVSTRKIVHLMPCLLYAGEPEDIDEIDTDTIECKMEIQPFLKHSIFP
jgi:phosphoribosylpyrophosphate synthetase